MKRRLHLLDSTTGETFDIPVYLTQGKRPTIYGSRWFQMPQDPLLALAQDRELWGLTRAVLDYLCGKLNFENYVFVAQKDIAKHLGVKQPKISVALKKLVNRQIIIEQKIGRTNFYRLNPAYGWKGNNKKAHEYQLELIQGGKS